MRSHLRVLAAWREVLEWSESAFGSKPSRLLAGLPAVRRKRPKERAMSLNALAASKVVDLLAGPPRLNKRACPLFFSAKKTKKRNSTFTRGNEKWEVVAMDSLPMMPACSARRLLPGETRIFFCDHPRHHSLDDLVTPEICHACDLWKERPPETFRQIPKVFPSLRTKAL